MFKWMVQVSVLRKPRKLGGARTARRGPFALGFEDATSGRVRVTVKDKVADKYADDVHVKVIGSANREFVSGETDLRGIFVADAIRGTSTIIARAEKNRYAFYRGKTSLGRVAPAPSTRRCRCQVAARRSPCRAGGAAGSAPW